MTEETIFLAALEKKDPTERAAYLDGACGNDQALRQRVEALLRSHQDPDSFLDVPAMARQAADAGDPDVTTCTPAHEAVDPEGEPTPESPDRSRAGPATRDEALAFLAPAREAGSLGRLDHYEVLE